MTSILLVYFSQGGTTARVAEAVAGGLRAKEREVDVCDLMSGPAPALDGYAALGAGFPVHYFRPPFCITKFIQGLPDLAGLPVFVFLLHGTHAGDAGNMARRALRRKGGRETGYFKARGADYYYEYVRRGYLFSPDNPIPAELEAARSFGESVAENIATGRTHREPDDPPAAPIYRMERLMTGRRATERIYSRLFRVRPDRCNACGLCTKVCPTRNITADAQGCPRWDRDCLLCLYCEMKCPREAIRSPVSWPLFSPFVNFNVWLARRNRAIQHVRVVQAKGRTRRLEDAT